MGRLKLKHLLAHLLLTLSVFLLFQLNIVQCFDDCSSLVLISLGELQSVVKILPGLIYLSNLGVGNSSAIECLRVLWLVVKCLGGILYGEMVLLHFDVAVSQVEISWSLDVSHNSKSLLVIGNVLLPGTGIALEQHLHTEKCLVVVPDSSFKILIFDADVSVVAFDIRNSELINNFMRWVVVDHLCLLWGSGFK